MGSWVGNTKPRAASGKGEDVTILVCERITGQRDDAEGLKMERTQILQSLQQPMSAFAPTSSNPCKAANRSAIQP